MTSFYSEQAEQKKTEYKELLGVIGSLSRLFSDGSNPYIDSRIAENVFCKAFSADNVSRTDLSADAKKNLLGIGIKTFIHNNGRTWQKIAEFNSAHSLFSAMPNHEKILKIAELRNERLATTLRTFEIDTLIYHLITRSSSLIQLFESSMPLIQLDKIAGLKIQDGNILFYDELEEYKFNISKSTLYKRFVLPDAIDHIDIEIFDDPYAKIQTLHTGQPTTLILPQTKKTRTSPSTKALIRAIPALGPQTEAPLVVLPLYSERGDKHVPAKSGLNQWNAGGRSRDANEVYIPIPAWIHKQFPRFFPPRDTQFELSLPSKEIINASVCQDGSKALMSNPNLKLGQWLLRQVLNLPEGELVTYEKLLEIGLDSVTIRKVSSAKYEIDFSAIGTYQNFEEENNSQS